MKRLLTAIVAATLGIAIGMASAEARGPRGGFDGGGCGNCSGPQGSGPAGVGKDQFQKFRADSLDLRQEMMLKRFEIQRENLKGAPDLAKIDQLKREIADVQVKIQALRLQNGLPERGSKKDGECGPEGCGTGGCNNGPCSQRY